MKRILTLASSVALVLGMLVVAAPAFAATLAVPGTYSTIQAAANAASSGDTITVAAGTYSGDIIIPTGLNNLTITGAGSGSTVLNLGLGYGINLNNGYAITGFTMSGFTVNSSLNTTYALKAYKADTLHLSNMVFHGLGSTTHDGGVDINTTSHVVLNNVSASGFHKNGFAVTSAYTSADSSTPSSDITFNNITANGNSWTGISFYTVGNDHSPTSIGGSANINGVHFTGMDTISGNGVAGIHIEGDSDYNEFTKANPVNTVTSDGTTLDLTHVAFSSNPTYDIINYQTAPVNAIGATFGGLTGNAMNSGQRTIEDGKIIDQLDYPHLGLVTYYSPSPTTKEQCMNNGWKTLVDIAGKHFKNQGDCVSFVATKGKNAAAGN